MQAGKVDVVSALIGARANIEAKTDVGFIAMHMAARFRRRPNVVSSLRVFFLIFLLEARGPGLGRQRWFIGRFLGFWGLGEKTPTKTKPLNEEATFGRRRRFGKVEVLKALVQARANVSARDNRGETPLDSVTSCARGCRARGDNKQESVCKVSILYLMSVNRGE